MIKVPGMKIWNEPSRFYKSYMSWYVPLIFMEYYKTNHSQSTANEEQLSLFVDGPPKGPLGGRKKVKEKQDKKNTTYSGGARSTK
jgi:hypothetical protein